MAGRPGGIQTATAVGPLPDVFATDPALLAGPGNSWGFAPISLVNFVVGNHTTELTKANFAVRAKTLKAMIFPNILRRKSNSGYSFGIIPELDSGS